jgi:hypothetical protein
MSLGPEQQLTIKEGVDPLVVERDQPADRQ